jgi:uncharacterized protein
VGWNVTTALDLVAIALSAVLVWRFFATGGGPMLREMDDPEAAHHAHHHHHAHSH